MSEKRLDYESIKNRIVTKSCPIKEELDNRVICGFNKIEIQLYPSNVDSDENTRKSIDACSRNDIDIVTVHSPLSSKDRFQLIGGFNLGKVVYLNTLIFAESLARYFGHNISVVFHTEMSISICKNSGGMMQYIVPELRRAIRMFPHVTYTIENVTPTDDCNGSFCSGSYFENVELCKILRESINKDYFFTTLDTCHALTTIKIHDILAEYGYAYEEMITLEKYFEKNALTCNNVHFADVEGLGFLEGQHGIKVSNDSSVFRDVLLYICRYLSQGAWVTLEVREDNYYDVKNAPSMRNEILEYCK